MNFADFSFCPAPTASQQPEAEKEEQADKQEQKKKKKKKVKPPEEGSFVHYEAQSNGGTAIVSADPSLQVSWLSFCSGQQSYVTLTVCPPAHFGALLCVQPVTRGGF